MHFLPFCDLASVLLCNFHPFESFYSSCSGLFWFSYSGSFRLIPDQNIAPCHIQHYLSLNWKPASRNLFPVLLKTSRFGVKTRVVLKAPIRTIKLNPGANQKKLLSLPGGREIRTSGRVLDELSPVAWPTQPPPTRSTEAASPPVPDCLGGALHHLLVLLLLVFLLHHHHHSGVRFPRTVRHRSCGRKREHVWTALAALVPSRGSRMCREFLCVLPSTWWLLCPNLWAAPPLPKCSGFWSSLQCLWPLVFLVLQVQQFLPLPSPHQAQAPMGTSGGGKHGHLQRKSFHLLTEPPPLSNDNVTLRPGGL